MSTNLKIVTLVGLVPVGSTVLTREDMDALSGRFLSEEELQALKDSKDFAGETPLKFMSLKEFISGTNDCTIHVGSFWMFHVYVSENQN